MRKDSDVIYFALLWLLSNNNLQAARKFFDEQNGKLDLNGEEMESPSREDIEEVLLEKANSR